MYRNVAGQIICAQLVDKTDGSAITSGDVDVYVLKDGGTQASGSGTATLEGNGCCSYAPTQGETDAAHVAFTFTHADAVPVTVQAYPQDKEAADRLTASANTICVFTVGSGTNNTTTISISGGAGACSPAPTETDQFKGRIVLFLRNTTTTALRGQGGPIEGNSTTALTLAAGDALTTAPSEGDIGVIL